jgi:hypothetical protein
MTSFRNLELSELETRTLQTALDGELQALRECLEQSENAKQGKVVTYYYELIVDNEKLLKKITKLYN